MGFERSHELLAAIDAALAATEVAFAALGAGG